MQQCFGQVQHVLSHYWQRNPLKTIPTILNRQIKGFLLFFTLDIVWHKSLVISFHHWSFRMVSCKTFMIVTANPNIRIYIMVKDFCKVETERAKSRWQDTNLCSPPHSICLRQAKIPFIIFQLCTHHNNSFVSI